MYTDVSQCTYNSDMYRRVTVYISDSYSAKVYISDVS